MERSSIGGNCFADFEVLPGSCGMCIVVDLMKFLESLVVTYFFLLLFCNWWCFWSRPHFEMVTAVFVFQCSLPGPFCCEIVTLGPSILMHCTGVGQQKLQRQLSNGSSSGTSTKRAASTAITMPKTKGGHGVVFAGPRKPDHRSAGPSGVAAAGSRPPSESIRQNPVPPRKRE